MTIPLWIHIIALSMVALVALAVSLPLLKPTRTPFSLASADPRKLRWIKQKEMAYAAVKEAEFDFQMGKLSPEDYQALRAKYEARALQALARLEELEQGGDRKSRE